MACEGERQGEEEHRQEAVMSSTIADSEVVTARVFDAPHGRVFAGSTDPAVRSSVRPA